MDQLQAAEFELNRILAHGLLDNELLRQRELYEKPGQPKETVPNWISYMEKHIGLAKAALEKGDTTESMEQIKFLGGLTLATIISNYKFPAK